MNIENMSVGQVMEPLLQRIERVIYRDLAYVAGGATILIAIYYAAFEQLPPPLPLFVQLYLVVISYAIGYVTQEFFSIFHIVSTSYIPSDENIAGILISTDKIKNIVKKFEWAEDIRDLPDKNEIDKREIKKRFNRDAPESLKQQRDRISDLKHVGTTLGPSFAVAGVIIIVSFVGKYFIAEPDASTVIGIGVGIALSIFSILLIITSWIKSYQQARLEIEYTE